MKLVLAALAITALRPVAYAADLNVFKICEDRRAIRTADGADAGHVEYVVLETSGQTVVAAIVTGGVLGTRLVSVPATAMEFGRVNDIALPQIRRERLLSAPVIERAQLLSRRTLRSDIVERSYIHFGATAHSGASGTDAGATPPAPSGGATVGKDPASPVSTEGDRAKPSKRR